jgi:hypothetical protein
LAEGSSSALRCLCKAARTPEAGGIRCRGRRKPDTGTHAGRTTQARRTLHLEATPSTRSPARPDAAASCNSPSSTKEASAAPTSSSHRHQQASSNLQHTPADGSLANTHLATNPFSLVTMLFLEGDDYNFYDRFF